MAFHISDASLDWALLHVERYRDTDVFPAAFEFEAIRYGWDEIKSWLKACNLQEWVARPKRSALTPKARYAYRISTQHDPIDALLYLAVLYEIGQELEDYRIDKNDQISFSHRFAPTEDGQLYERSSNWTTFTARCRELATGSSVSHVVVADIADFFPRLYQHRVHNALDAATGGLKPHVGVLINFFRRWADGDSHGIPVGPAASRRISEVTLDDVDQNLRAEGTTFCRYSDDYRIFCTSQRAAHERLTRLADLLYSGHGLTLQQGKTDIVPVETFLLRYVGSPESQELLGLVEKVARLVEALDLGDPYEEFRYEDLTAEHRRLVDQLNLENILQAQLAAHDPDFGLIRFVLRRLAQLGDHTVALDLVRRAEHLYQVTAPMVEYLQSLRSMPSSLKTEIGRELMKLIASSSVGDLPYHRCWLLSPFSRSGGWGQEDSFVQTYNAGTESFSRRKAILAIGHAKQLYWFRMHRQTALALDDWERRAFLAGASCLASDERNFWYRSLRPNLDRLEQSIVVWASDNPF